MTTLPNPDLTVDGEDIEADANPGGTTNPEVKLSVSTTQPSIFLPENTKAVEDSLSNNRDALARTISEEDQPMMLAKWNEFIKHNENISFEDVIRYIRTIRKESPIQLAQEIQLAISENPGDSSPYNVGVFTPIKPASKEHRTKICKNLKVLIKMTLKFLGIPSNFIKSNGLVDKMYNKYCENLRKVRESHAEIRTGNLNLTVNDMTKAFYSSRLTTGENNEKITTIKTIYEQILRRHDISSNFEFSEVEVKEELPDAYFTRENFDRFSELMMFLSELKLIDLEKCTEIITSQDEVTMERMYNRILSMVKYIIHSNHEIIGFLNTGEKIFSAMQSRYFPGATLPRTDRLDIFEDLKNMSPCEQFKYALKRSHTLELRHQAMMIAFLRLKLIMIKKSPEFIQATNTLRKMRSAYVSKDKNGNGLWEMEDGSPKLVRHIIYHNNRGDYSVKKSDEYIYEHDIGCRVYQGHSGRKYHVRIIDNENARKEANSVLFKSLIQGAKADPENLYDLSRITFVFAYYDDNGSNVQVDLNDPIVKKDVYDFLIKLAERQDLYVQTKKDETIDWESDSAEEIYSKLSKDRADIRMGYGVIEDKGMAKKDKHSSETFTDVKLVAKNAKYGTGLEIQIQDLSLHVGAISKHHPDGHNLYDDRKTRLLLTEMYPASIYPKTYFRLVLAELYEQSSTIKYRISESEDNEKQKKLRKKLKNIKKRITNLLKLVETIEAIDENLSNAEEFLIKKAEGLLETT